MIRRRTASRIATWTAAIGAVALTASQSSAAVVLSEDFESYADTTALRAVWTIQPNANVNDANHFSLDTNGYDPTVNGKGDPGYAPSPLPAIPYSSADGINTTTEVSKLGRFGSPTTGGNPIGAYRALTTPVSGSGGFSVSVDMIQDTYGRNVGFGLFDAAGTSGYVLRWQGSNVNQNSGRGAVQLYRYATNNATAFDIAVAGDYDGNAGVDLGTGNKIVRPGYATDADGVPNESDPTPYSAGASGNGMTPVMGYHRRMGLDAALTNSNAELMNFDADWEGLGTFKLVFTPNVTRTNPVTSLSETGGLLEVFVISITNPNLSIPVASVIDPTALDATVFERLYLIGRHANVDNIVVDDLLPVPEPASLGLLGLGALAMFRRRRSA